MDAQVKILNMLAFLIFILFMSTRECVSVSASVCGYLKYQIFLEELQTQVVMVCPMQE